ncbi:hypothetical protein GCM10022234_23320 [Aeromicrobium panaciterrae]
MALTIVGVVWFILDIVTARWTAVSVAAVIASYIVGMWVVVLPTSVGARPEEAGGPTRLRKPVVRHAPCRTELDRSRLSQSTRPVQHQ